MKNILELLNEKKILESRINEMIHGSIEIREQNKRKYIYVHFRDNGMSISKYAGEYNIELNNLILTNNKLVKEYKKRLKEIKKELGLMQYTTNTISENVKMNIDLARRNMVDSIYKQAKLEGVATTYSDTETIINAGKVSDMSIKDISKVINLKHAWEFILNEGVVSCPTNYTILCQINEIIEDGFLYSAGKLRSVPVSIGGSNYLPPLPYGPQIKNDLEKILSKDKSYDVAIELLIYVMKKQLFIDGNKRTAVIFANHYLISRGMGLIVIPIELIEEFKKHLINYYEEVNEEINTFLLNKCLIKIFE